MGRGRLCRRVLPYETVRGQSNSRRHSQTGIQDTTDQTRHTRVIDFRGNAFCLGVAPRPKVGLILSAISIIAAPFVKDVLLIVDAIVAGVGVGIVWTNTDTLVSKLAKEGKLGATMGAAGSFKEFGDMVGPILIGVLSQALGLTWGFVICGVLGLLSIALIQARKS